MEIFKSEDMEDLLNNKDPKVWIAVVSAIQTGIDKNLKSVECFQVESPTSITTFKMHKDEWKATLESALNFYISLENYETCTIIKKYLEKHEKERNSIPNN